MPARAHDEVNRRDDRQAKRSPSRERDAPTVDVPGPHVVGAEAIAAMQRTAGNRAATRAVQRAPVVGTITAAPAARVQRQAEHWAKATYPSAQKSMEDHFRRHPSAEWSTVQEYTDKAIEVLNANYNSASEHKLADGSWGWKIRTSDYFGIYTNDDKIVTFGER